MIKTNLFIPKRIKVGFQNRRDTFTGKLAYVIYFDERNTLRKVKSWEGWRDDSIEPIEYENKPQNGFILNKGVERYSDWGSGRSVVRVYDSRDFEFEISVDNLLGILMHSDVSKRDITEECVFAWHGADLILLPCNSVEYKESVEYTAKQDLKVSTKVLVPGRRYNRKKTEQSLLYMGRFDWWDFKTPEGKKYGDKKIHANRGKKHIFWDGYSFEPTSVSILSSEVSEDIDPDYANLVDKWYTTINSQQIIGVKTDPAPGQLINRDMWYGYPRFDKFENGILQRIGLDGYHSSFAHKNVSRCDISIQFEEDKTITENIVVSTSGYSHNYKNYYRDMTWELRPCIKEEAMRLGYDIETLNQSQYGKVMQSLGYGEGCYVLKNGNLVKI